MRSCIGCRALLRGEGCGDHCILKPCLQWIESPDSQANVTLFLSKFYGRSYLMNCVTATPEHLRHATFRSLLFEACGRIVNPVYGAVGLLWSGNWNLCQAAVEEVTKGNPIGSYVLSEFGLNNEIDDIKEVVSSKKMRSSGASHDEDESSSDSSGSESVNQSGVGGIPSLNSAMSWHPSNGSDEGGEESESLTLSLKTERVFFFE